MLQICIANKSAMLIATCNSTSDLLVIQVFPSVNHLSSSTGQFSDRSRQLCHHMHRSHMFAPHRRRISIHPNSFNSLPTKPLLIISQKMNDAVPIRTSQ